jgi:hypothetical protein
MTLPAIDSELASLALHMARRRSEVVPLLELVRETFGERAALREYVGGWPRDVAEEYAFFDTCELLGVRVTAAAAAAPRGRRRTGAHQE